LLLLLLRLLLRLMLLWLLDGQEGRSIGRLNLL
jgi:hypothetical protein